MQMIPIISEVYNRSINLLTARKGSGVVAASQLAGVARPPPPIPRRALVCARSLTTGLHTTVDKCSLLAYHLYAWGFVLSLARASFPARSLSSELAYVPHERLAIDSFPGGSVDNLEIVPLRDYVLSLSPRILFWN